MEKHNENGSNRCHAEFQRHILRSLLHYHERMMMDHRKCPGGECRKVDECREFDGDCPNSVFIDGYADALREAIRCIEIVHRDELSGS